MAGYPSLDSYDLQGLTADEAALYGDDIRIAFDDLDPLTGADGFALAVEDTFAG